MSERKLERGYVETLRYEPNGIADDLKNINVEVDGRYRAKWEQLKKWIANYENCKKMPEESLRARYCIAISCQDLLKKMDEIESQ